MSSVSSASLLRRMFLTFGLVALFVMPSQGAGISFNVTFNDIVNGTNVGFDDPIFGASRVSTFLSTLGTVDAAVADSGILDIEVQNSQTDGSGFLASAGPFFSGGPNGFQNGSAFTHITTGVDPFGGVADIETTFDFGYNWNSELDAPTGSEFDLASVSLHEITHGLGFLSLLTSTGVSAITGTDPGVFSVYDSFLERGDGTALFGPGGDYLGGPGDLVSNDVFFDGPNATAANAGNPVQVYAPGAFAQGSSISHVQAATLMNFAIAPGVVRRSYSAQELGILYDIGYAQPGAMPAIPEPSSFALMGLAAIGLIRIRRRKQPA